MEELKLNEDINRVYQLPTEITAELKMKGFIPITLLITLAIMLFVAQRFEGLVFTPFKYVWYGWNLIVGFIMCIKSQKNGDKRIIQSILLFLSRDKNAYKPIDNPKSYTEIEVSDIDETQDSEYYS